MGERNRLKEVFSDAAELSGLEREQYLDRACAGDNALRERVEDLLSGLGETANLLDASSVGEFLSRAGPEEEEDALPVGGQIGRYRILRLIGKGGMGEVYEADDPDYGRRVALKTLRPEFLYRKDLVARFRREIRLAWLVTHPNICRVYDIAACQIRGANSVFFTMELLEGETLAQRLKRGPVEPDEAVGIFQQLAAGLEALHNSGLVHRDLKPANVILSSSAEGPRYVITDFGVAQQPELEPGEEPLTLMGQVIGTPAYMAPEQLAGKKVVHQSDIYSLGIVMYEVLCGRRPFSADQVVESAAQKSRAPHPPSRVRPLDPRWDSLILQCLDPAIGKRPATAQEVSLRLRSLATRRRPGGLLWARARRAVNHGLVRRPVFYAATAAGVVVVVLTMRVSVIRTPLLRYACRQLPGVAAVCELPASRNMVLFPAVVEGATVEDQAIAAGLAQYVRQSFQRLFPNPGSVCVHLRDDRLADGVSLVVETKVQSFAGKLVVTFAVREQGDQGDGPPLTLRRAVLSVPRSDAIRLHKEPVLRLAGLLEAEINPAEWRGWLQMAPRRPESLLAHLAGLGHLQKERLDEAAKAFNSAVEQGADFAFVPAQVGLGDAYRLLGNKTHNQAFELRARQAYQRAVPLDRDFGFARAERHWGELEAGAGNVQAAIEHLSNARRFWPYDSSVQNSLSSAYEAAKQDHLSAAILRDAVQQAPKCWLTHNALANFYSRRARFQEAEAELLEAVRLAPGNAAAYHNLAFDYLKAGRLDDAIEMASKAISLRPDALTFSTLGRAYLYRGCRAEAMAHLQKAIQLEPAGFVFWANLSEGLHASGKDSAPARKAISRTVELARHALEQAPTQAYTRAQLALNLARLGQSSEALEEIHRALLLAPESHDIVLLSAETFEVLRSRPLALAQLERALRGGLSVHEVASSFGLGELRRDPAYISLLRRLKLNPSADPGGVTRRTGPACLVSAIPVAANKF